MLTSFQKNRLRRDRQAQWIGLQGAGGVDNHTLVPDPRAMPYRVTGIVGLGIQL